jgi:hypothetical protein
MVRHDIEWASHRTRSSAINWMQKRSTESFVSLCHLLAFKSWLLNPISKTATVCSSMSMDVDARGMTRDHICSTLHVGPNRLSRAVRFCQNRGASPPPRTQGRPKKMTPEILDFIYIRTLQCGRLSRADLGLEVRSRFGISVSPLTDRIAPSTSNGKVALQ